MGSQPKSISLEKVRPLLARRVRSVYVPSSVYRLQFNKQFNFEHAHAAAGYLRELGVDVLYSSPYFQAAPGSMHGYDIVNPNKINPEIGSEETYGSFCEKLQREGVGQIIDVVPNHMGILGNQNLWWNDVLENGPSSLYAHFFDIEWDPAKAELKDKVLIPVLGDLYGALLEGQEIRIGFSSPHFFVHYHEHRFPVDPKTYPLLLEHGLEDLKGSLGAESEEFSEYLSVVTAFRNLPGRTERSAEKMQERSREKEMGKKRLAELVARSSIIQNFIESRIEIFNGRQGDPKSFDLLDRFLNEQAYRLAFWRVAAEEINYRRFFNINELAAIRIEDERVFREHHKLLFQLVREGKVRGVRTDHPDGLYDPPTYFRRLQRECLIQLLLRDLAESDGQADNVDEDGLRKKVDEILEREYRKDPPFFVVVEKILDRNEPLPDDWYVYGTVGYEYLNALNGIFVDPMNADATGKVYEDFIGHPIDFDQLVYDKKKFFALVHMASEINALGHRLDYISERDRRYRDFTRNNLTLAIREVIACFPVYRTYISSDKGAVSERDMKYIRMAVAKAKSRTPALNSAVYDFLENVLLLKLDPGVGEEEAALYLDFVLRFQQLTGPIMAKGLEDTAFYVYNRLVSLNEVGGDPFHFGYTKDEFHQFIRERSGRWPCAMITTSTHDTKRSEDVRARINVLSEIPQEWEGKILKWAAMNERYKTSLHGVLEPRRNTEYFIYQTLLGAWPQETPFDENAFFERMWQYLLKAVREAKTYTSWARPNAEYEEAVKKFLTGILDPKSSDPFLSDFTPFREKIAFYGRLNSLSALVLKIGSPGVLDTYQGTEFFELSLVDPDNRRPVDFDIRAKRLASLKSESQSKKSPLEFLAAGHAASGGDLKLYILWKGLSVRKKYHDLFVRGEYVPLEVRGKRERNVIAFLRKWGEQAAIVVSARFFTELLPETGSLLPPASVWEDTEILLPSLPGVREKWTEIISEQELQPVECQGKVSIKASVLFKRMNSAILVNPHDA